ncbi:uncharacterized protein LOC111616785 [Centruroides sculpturatus]|uniref:uncharacterized protein LOC111616785 n=1 Tax=Centruroides sculpturatus TaxID=218467 RepID=UPI000C6DC92A|nr:uncharacterized protein LOC111616785 [Centruroides sculpturatus]
MKNLISVSLYQSISKLQSHCVGEKTAAFCGIKFHIICIIIFEHITVMVSYGTVEKLQNIPELFSYVFVEIAFSDKIMIEIFFFISAFLLSYNNQKNVKCAMDICVLIKKKTIRSLNFALTIQKLNLQTHDNHRDIIN